MEQKINCPYCVLYGKTPDKKQHLYINTISNLFFCQRCNHAGLWDDDMPPIELSEPSAKFDKVELFKFNELIMSEDKDKVLKYALSRLPEEIVLKETMWSSDMPTRLFFPIFVKDNIVTWQARSIVNANPKYISWGKVSEYVYNIKSTDWAVLCEGPINALSCPNGIAIFGKSLSGIQEFMIVSVYKKIYLALDYGTDKEREKIKNKLKRYIEVIDIKFEDKRDINDLGYDYISDKLRSLGENI